MGVVMEESSVHHSRGDFELRVVTATEISFTFSVHVALCTSAVLLGPGTSDGPPPAMGQRIVALEHLMGQRIVALEHPMGQQIVALEHLMGQLWASGLWLGTSVGPAMGQRFVAWNICWASYGPADCGPGTSDGPADCGLGTSDGPATGQRFVAWNI